MAVIAILLVRGMGPATAHTLCCLMLQFFFKFTFSRNIIARNGIGLQRATITLIVLLIRTNASNKNIRTITVVWVFLNSAACLTNETVNYASKMFHFILKRPTVPVITFIFLITEFQYTRTSAGAVLWLVLRTYNGGCLVRVDSSAGCTTPDCTPLDYHPLTLSTLYQGKESVG